jgi:hypothetical protein
MDFSILSHGNLKLLAQNVFVTHDFVLIELGMGSQIVVNLFWKMPNDNWCTWMYGEPR